MKILNFRTATVFLCLMSLSHLLRADSVDELLDVMDVEKQMLGGFDAMMPMVDQLALQFSLDENGKEELIGIYRTWYDEDIDREKLIKGLADLYRETFSENEIQEMLSFFRSTVGQKVLKESPMLMKKGAELGMLEAQEKQSLLLERLEPFFEKHSVE